MMKQSLKILVLLFILLFSFRAASAVPNFDEKLFYKIDYLGFIPLGKVQITSEPYLLAKQDINKLSAAYQPLSLLSWILNIKGKMNSYVHAKTKLPVRYEEFYSFYGHKDESNVLVYDQENGQVYIDRNGEKETKKIPYYTLDPLSGVSFLRNSSWLVGLKKTYNLNSHQSNYRFNLHCVDHLEMKTVYGQKKAWVIEGILKKAKEFHEKPDIEFKVWLLDEPSRQPLQFKIKTPYGSVKLRLIDV